MGNFVEVEFKGKRLDFYSNPDDVPFDIDDFIIIESDKGYDIGRVHHVFDSASHCMMKDDMYKVLRKASQEELNQFKENRIREEKAKPLAKRLFKKHELDIKLSEVEYQLDRNKVTFYFTSDERVDFRELVKDLAQEYKTRIELRQINSREEARKIGGCGSCGLELCCATCILKDFIPISTQFAKNQLLPTNPTKLTGMCGRLRCCLRYELQMYNNVLREYPKIDAAIKTPAGIAYVEKIDIFKETVYLRYDDGIMEPLPVEDVRLLLTDKI